MILVAAGIVDWLFVIIIIPAGILLHLIVDIFSIITYHPRNVLKGDKFYFAWHAVVWLVSVFVVFWFLNAYWLGMLASVLPDIYDWLIIRTVRAIKKKQLGDDYENHPEFFAGKEFHANLERFRDEHMPWLPDRSERRSGIIPEVVIWSVSFLFIFFLP